LRRLFAKRAPERFSRRWPRIEVTEPASLKLPDGRDQMVIVNQLSVGGARVQTTVPLQAGDNIELKLQGDIGGQSLMARIVYSLKEHSGYYFACGLCFLGLRPHETQWIVNFIAAEQARRRTPNAPGDP
jgi:hypothetical protein